MARKSVKGYAEKNYYDVTRFSGGIVATNDPLNEGYFKHLVNFDISDMGQSLTPRKGFLTTTCKDEDDNIVTFSNKTVYYYDANIGKWIFVDFGNLSKYVEPRFVITYESSVDIEYADEYSVITEEKYLIDAGDSEISEVALRYRIINDKPIIYRFGFTNKEVNIDLSISSLSDAPKIEISYDGKDYNEYNLTDTIQTNTGALYVKLSKDPNIKVSDVFITYIYLYAKDAYVGYWVNDIVWKPSAYLIDFDVNDKYINNVKKISNIENIANIIKIDSIENNNAQSAYNEYSINTYICKINNTLTTFMYRENSSEYESVDYPGDTLIIDKLNTDDIVDYVDTSKRNLASSASIIPDPMQIVYKDGEQPDGFVQQFPMIYVRTAEDKYLINTTKEVEGLTIIPNFELKEFSNNEYTYTENEEEKTIPKYLWAYAYDITPTALIYNSPDDLKEVIYRSPVYSLDTDKVLIGYHINDKPIYEMYKADIDAINKLPKDTVDSSVSHTHFATYEAVEEFVKELNVLTPDNIANSKYNQDYTYIIYVVPKIEDKSTPIDSIRIPYEIFQTRPDTDTQLLKSIWYSNTDYRFDDLEEFYTHPYIWTPELEKEYKEYDPRIENFLVDPPVFEGTEATLAYKLLRAKYSIYSKPKSINTLDKLLKDLNTFTSGTDINDVLQIFEQNSDNYRFYIKSLKDIKEYNDTTGYYNIAQTALHSDIIAFKNGEELTYTELKKKIEDIKDMREVIFNVFEQGAKVSFINKDLKSINNIEHISNLQRFLPQVFTEQSITYKIYTRVSFKGYTINLTNLEDKLAPNVSDQFTEKHSDKIKANTSTLTNLFSIVVQHSQTVNPSLLNSQYTLFLPKCKNYTDSIPNLRSLRIGEASVKSENMFSKVEDVLQCTLNDNWKYNELKNEDYFEQGLLMTFYLMKVPNYNWLLEEHPDYANYTQEYFKTSTTLFQNRQLIKDSKEPLVYTIKLEEEPKDIRDSTNNFIFHSTLGDHLVVYVENKLYISKENKQYYFTYDNTFTYPEKIVKAIQYKDMILVFTTQNLYAVYFTEYVTNVQNGTDDEGNPRYIQQTTYVFATLPVLYNLMVDERYKNAIQVYNQMVLFYSADGQMFLIKPTAAIDSNTRFSIQYFNKSANDILLNYKQYMQERLTVYGVDKVIEDVEIKVSASINYIKIFYTAKDIMTYILIYDILNNRYYVYDTLMFTKVNSLQYIPSGELYIVEDSNKLYFTLPYTQPNEVNNNVDITYKDYFCNYPIYSELDTGTINLNNHLKKRFKDIHVIYKNLNATDIGFSLETFIDDVPVITYIESNLEVRDIAGSKTLVSVESNKVTNFLENNTALFNFTDYTSNKIITHKTNIVSRGKTVRTKLHFTSKGKYKIQGFGLIYKEHTV